MSDDANNISSWLKERNQIIINGKVGHVEGQKKSTNSFQIKDNY